MQTERLKWTGEKYKEKLRQLKEDCHLTAFVAVIQAASKHFGAREKATVDEISNYTVADKTLAAGNCPTGSMVPTGISVRKRVAPVPS